MKHGRPVNYLSAPGHRLGSKMLQCNKGLLLSLIPHPPLPAYLQPPQLSIDPTRPDPTP